MRKTILAMLICSTLLFVGCFGVNKKAEDTSSSQTSEQQSENQSGENYEIYKNSIDTTNSKDKDVHSHGHENGDDEDDHEEGNADDSGIIIDTEKRNEARKETDENNLKNAKITADEALNLVKSKVKLTDGEVLLLAQNGDIFKSPYNGRDCFIIIKEKILDDDGECDIVCEYEVDTQNSNIVMRERSF